MPVRINRRDRFGYYYPTKHCIWLKMVDFEAELTADIVEAIFKNGNNTNLIDLISKNKEGRFEILPYNGKEAFVKIIPNNSQGRSVENIAWVLDKRRMATPYGTKRVVAYANGLDRPVDEFTADHHPPEEPSDASASDRPGRAVAASSPHRPIRRESSRSPAPSPESPKVLVSKYRDRTADGTNKKADTDKRDDRDQRDFRDWRDDRRDRDDRYKRRGGGGRGGKKTQQPSSRRQHIDHWSPGPSPPP